MIKVAVDAMSGDYAPGEMVAGAVEAVNAKSGIQVFLVGQEQAVVSELSKHTCNKDQTQVVNTIEAIATEEPPVNAIRKKKDSSIVVGLNPVKQGEADAFVSAGSSGAILAGGQAIVGCNKGVERPPLAPFIPTERGVSLLINCGANVDARASYLVQFVQMDSVYMEYVMGTKNPRVAIVNIGAEREKGNALVKETFPLLKECKGINFIGNIKAGEIPHGGADVTICEAFVGSIILKLYKEVGATLASMVKGGMMSALRNKIGALLVKPVLRETLKSFDGSQYGGAPLLGLKGLVAKIHGNSERTEVRNFIIQRATFKEQDTNGKIRQCLDVQNEKQVRGTKLRIKI